MDHRDIAVAGMTCAEAEEMAALCVLDVLTPEEAAPVHAHLAACDRPHADIQHAAEAAGALALSVDPVLPPVDLRDRLMRTVAATPQVPDALTRDHLPNVVLFARPARSTRSRPSRTLWAGLAAAAVIVLVLGAWNVSLQQRLSGTDEQLALVRAAVAAAADPSSTVATLTGTDAAPGASGMAVMPASGTGYLMLQGLPTLAADQVYQAWYLADGVPTSAGLMPSTTGVSVMAGLQPVPGTDTIALTIEPAGGLPQPSGAVVIAGTLAG